MANKKIKLCIDAPLREHLQEAGVNAVEDVLGKLGGDAAGYETLDDLLLLDDDSVFRCELKSAGLNGNQATRIQKYCHLFRTEEEEEERPTAGLRSFGK